MKRFIRTRGRTESDSWRTKKKKSSLRMRRGRPFVVLDARLSGRLFLSAGKILLSLKERIHI